MLFLFIKASTAATDAHPLCFLQYRLVFPANLTTRQRAILHSIGEECGIPHESHGEGEARSICLGDAAKETIKVRLSEAEHPSDSELIKVVQTYLNRDATNKFMRPLGAVVEGTYYGKRMPTTSNQSQLITVDAFISQFRPLLLLEREAEVAQAEALTLANQAFAQAKGVVLLNLYLKESEGGLLGRMLLTFVNNRGQGVVPLPPHKLTPHDIVRIRPHRTESAGPPLAEGVVYRVTDYHIIVAVEEMLEESLDIPLKLEKMANEVTHRRLVAALAGLEEVHLGKRETSATTLVDVLFGRHEPRYDPSPPSWRPVNAALDASQMKAVSLALAAQDIALIHGPPGTGKTTSVVEYIAQEVGRGHRVLACAASNVAVDNLVEKIAAACPQSKVVRVGHPARLLPAVLNASLEARVLASDNSALAKDCRHEMKSLNAKLFKLGRGSGAQRRAIRTELRLLAKEERRRQERAIQEVLSDARVVCCTLTGVGTSCLRKVRDFDVVVIDEAAQAVEPACWSALLRGRKAVLAGDHLQLPPTVLSAAAASGGLSRTLFERLQDLWGASVSEMLTVQYRMNSAIGDWSSREFYKGRLQAHHSVAEHTLRDIVSNTPTDASLLAPLLLIDTSGLDMEEYLEEEGESLWNDGEAQVTMTHALRIIEAGVSPANIGIITPYAAQVGKLRELRPENLSSILEVCTVDGFQGREKEVIIISMVRSNHKGDIGFLAEARRMNVAVTRARRQCTLVCDSETVSKDAFLSRLVAWFEEHGEISSAADYVSS